MPKNVPGLQNTKTSRPFDNLPTELIEQIFELSIPIPAPNTFQNSFSGTQAPLLLCRVCKLWRAIAWQTPTLWATLNILQLPHSPPSDHVVQFTKQWLARSAERPLTLSFNQPRGAAHELQPYFDVLNTVSHRWHDVHFHLRATSLAVLLPVKGKLPLLQDFFLTIVDDSPYSMRRVPVEGLDAFENSPLLHTVRLEGLHGITLPWTQLKKFVSTHSYALSHNDCVELLDNCPNLISCTFGAVSIGDSINTSRREARAAHNQLQILDVTHSAGLHLFLDDFTFPGLREIRFADSIRHSGNATFSQSFESLASSALLLNRLVLTHVSGVWDVAPLLQVLPHVTHVDIDFSLQLSKDILRCFLPLGPSKTLLVPRLHTLKLRSLRDDPRSTLLDIINLRCSKVGENSPLKTLKTIWIKVIQDDEVYFDLNFQKRLEGFDVSVNVLPYSHQSDNTHTS